MGRVIKINPRDGNKHYLMEKDVTYDSSETKSLINTTLSTKGWSTKHFPYILNKIGLKTPIVIEKVNASSNMYQMVGNLKFVGGHSENPCYNASRKERVIWMM